MYPFVDSDRRVKCSEPKAALLPRLDCIFTKSDKSSLGAKGLTCSDDIA